MHVPLADNIDWVGHIDWNVRDFHSYHTRYGATYNSYLVRDEATALIDTVKAPYADDLLGNVRELVPLKKVKYIVCNHAEPDHSGSLPAVVQACPGATIVCDAKCRDILSSYYDASTWSFRLVSTGDTLSLGSRTLAFVETPMVHWPDSMFTYVPEEKLLFSMDAFGQHYASTARFDDEVPLERVMEEAKTYYANIVMLYGKRIGQVMDQAKDLDIRMIAPSHGVVWRSHIDRILSAYREWTVFKPKAKVVVLYDSMWESTTRMAEAVAEGAARPGVEALSLHVRRTDDTRTVTEVLDAACLAVGSSTLNMGMMPSLARTLTYLKGLKPRNKQALAFGTHGWGKGGPEAVQEYLEAMKLDIVQEPYKVQWRPKDAELDECRRIGGLLAEKALAAAEG